MNAQELYEEWTSGEQNGMRPKRVQKLRDDLVDVMEIPVPHRLPEIESWLARMQSSGTVTKKLKGAAEGSDDAESDGGDA